MDIKAQQETESKQAKAEKNRIDRELEMVQTHNRNIIVQTKDLRDRFTSSLQLLKTYKDRLTKEQNDKIQHENLVKKLQEELDQARRELQIASSIAYAEKEIAISQPNTKAGTIKSAAKEAFISESDSQNSGPIRKISLTRLQRLLDIQDNKLKIKCLDLNFDTKVAEKEDIISNLHRKDTYDQSNEDRDSSTNVEHISSEMRNQTLNGNTRQDSVPQSPSMNIRGDSVCHLTQKVLNENVDADSLGVDAESLTLISELNTKIGEDMLLQWSYDETLFQTLDAMEARDVREILDYQPNSDRSESDDEDDIQKIAIRMNRKVLI
uniref:Uncharacterized protein n=1 Tax=Spongospora subterranea TaxID=70186 RepID=A0A0H5QY64_9EUKA|eukprot:CRZ06667.1 hypothetical protein [Spongospora subterranea]